MKIPPPPWADRFDRIASFFYTSEAVSLVVWMIAGGLWGWNLYMLVEFSTR